MTKNKEKKRKDAAEPRLLMESAGDLRSCGHGLHIGSIGWQAMTRDEEIVIVHIAVHGPAISAALGPNVGRPPCRKMTTTTRPMLVFA